MASSLYDIAPLSETLAAGVTLLTPNQRLARRICAQWDAQQAAAGATAWPSANVHAVQPWLERQWELAVADRHLEPGLRLGPAQALQVWHRAIEQVEGRENALGLLQPRAAASLAAQARETLLLWQVDPRSERWRGAFAADPDCAVFLRWLDAFEGLLASAGQLTGPDAISALLQLPAPVHPGPVVLLECDGLPPLYNCALEAIAGTVERIEPAQPRADKSVYSFEDTPAQLRAVAQWTARTYQEDPNQRIGIVLTDMQSDRIPFEYQLRSAFDCLGENYTSLPVNFSTGMPLAHTPVVRDALRALSMGLPETTVPEVVTLLNSRYFALDDAGAPLANLVVKQLHDAGASRVSVARLRTTLCEATLGEEQGVALGSILQQVAQLRHLTRPALPGRWGEYFLEVLQHWGWPGETQLDSLEFQQVARWYELLDTLRRFDAVSEPLDYEQALALVREQALATMSQPQTADSQVQVLGPLEAVGLQFDHLWLLGMDASQWPESPRPNAFLPVHMQIALGMPRASHTREAEVATLRMAQYARAVDKLHCGYARQDDGASALPSVLLAGFTPATLPDSDAVPQSWQEQFANRQLESVPDDRAPALQLEPGARHGGGAGLIEDQSNCAFRAFARHRLRVEPLPAFSLGLSASERGTILHDALHALWGSLGDQQRLLALDDAQCATEAASAAEKGLARVYGKRRGDLPVNYWSLERGRLEGLLLEWLQLERDRPQFVVRAREENCTLPLSQLDLKFRIDRVDELADGTLLILDYKSSAGGLGDLAGERPASPQLMLYRLAYPEPVEGVAFAQVRRDDCKFVGVGSGEFAGGIKTEIKPPGGEEPLDWEALIAQSGEALETLARAFIDGHAEVDPLSPASCKWCGLQSLCRVESVIEAEDAEEDE